MTQQTESGLYKNIKTLGEGLAMAAAILGTPLLFNATKLPLYYYLRRAWGEELSALLVWIMGLVEAYVIYAAVSLVFTAAVVWIMTRLAARQFGE